MCPCRNFTSVHAAFMLFQKAQYNAQLTAKAKDLAELNSTIQELKVQGMSIA